MWIDNPNDENLTQYVMNDVNSTMDGSKFNTFNWITPKGNIEFFNFTIKRLFAMGKYVLF